MTRVIEEDNVLAVFGHGISETVIALFISLRVAFENRCNFEAELSKLRGDVLCVAHWVFQSRHASSIVTVPYDQSIALLPEGMPEIIATREATQRIGTVFVVGYGFSLDLP